MKRVRGENKCGIALGEADSSAKRRGKHFDEDLELIESYGTTSNGVNESAGSRGWRMSAEKRKSIIGYGEGKDWRRKRDLRPETVEDFCLRAETIFWID